MNTEKLITLIQLLTDEKDELEYRYLEIVDILERDKKL